MELLKHLQTRQAEGNPIRTGLVGCGQEGSGMVRITNKMPGLITAAIADIDVNRPLNTLAALGIPRAAICVTNEPGPAQDALAEGHYVVTEDALLLAQMESIDAVVEATGVTDVGAQVAWHSIMAGQHVIMLNVETDVTVGLMLSHLAQKVGCVYTASTGDEPGVCKQLYDFAVSLGFEMVCLGKGKNNPIDFYAMPETCRAEAERKNMNPKMLSAFKDGTKTMVEFAAMVNATGLVPDVPGRTARRLMSPISTRCWYRRPTAASSPAGVASNIRRARWRRVSSPSSRPTTSVRGRTWPFIPWATVPTTRSIAPSTCAASRRPRPWPRRSSTARACSFPGR